MPRQNRQAVPPGTARPMGTRSPPLARAPPAPRVLRWTLLAACGARPGAVGPSARRATRSPSPGHPRGRPRPSETETPRLPKLSCHGPPQVLALPPPSRMAGRAGLRRRAPETQFLEPSDRVAQAPATDTNSWQRRPSNPALGNMPSTRLRGKGHEACRPARAPGTPWPCRTGSGPIGPHRPRRGKPHGPRPQLGRPAAETGGLPG